MDPITRMMKRYINMPQKTLPLLFIGVLLLSSTTGCLDLFKKRNDIKGSLQYAETYKGRSITLERLKDVGGRWEDSGQVDAGRGGTWITKYDDRERITRIELTYPNGQVMPIEPVEPRWVTGVFYLPGHWLVLYPDASSLEAASPQLPPLTPFTSGISDNTQANDATTEHSTTDSGTGGWPGFPIQNGSIRSGDTGEIIQGGV